VDHRALERLLKKRWRHNALHVLELDEHDKGMMHTALSGVVQYLKAYPRSVVWSDAGVVFRSLRKARYLIPMARILGVKIDEGSL